MFAKGNDPAAIRQLVEHLAASKADKGIAIRMGPRGQIVTFGRQLSPEAAALAGRLGLSAGPQGKKPAPQPSPAEPVRAAFDLASILPPKP